VTPRFPLVLVSLAVSLFGSSTSLKAADNTSVPVGWFPWPYAEPVPGSALDTSALNDKPAGARGRVVVRDGHFVTADSGERLRFWGCNISSNEAFVDAATADRLARRLAMGGVNIARLHHLDNPWSVDSAGSLWKPGSQDRVHLDPAQLDKLHRLVAALKAEGIYSNVNLKVSRTHTEADGFPPSIAQTPAFQKRVDYFSRRIIDLQKDYARQLLTAKNPYTGLSLAEDPAVAVIEINNENSLVGLRTRELGADLHLLPEPFRGELTAQWNGWLARRYADRSAIAAAWSPQGAPRGESPLAPGSRWHAEAMPGNAVLVDSPDPATLHVTVQPGDGVRFRSAAFLDQLHFVEGATYTLTFSARANVERPIEVTASRDEPLWRTDKWRTVGLRSIVKLSPEWQEFRLVFVTHSIVDVLSRLSILAGHVPGEMWIKDLRLEAGSATAGLEAGQSARQGTVPIPTDATPSQWNDWLTFLLDTERSYVAEMRAYLRDDLKVTAPIVCTQANYGGIAGLVREQPSDFIDSHCYWQHPDWGNRQAVWDTANYTITNTPQIAEFGPRWFGEIGGLAQLRVAGKPFTVTEVDYPAPNDYACEFYPVFATYAGLQDWDGLFPFDMVAGGVEPDDGSIRTFFDQSHHPAKWGMGPFATRVFRQGLVPAAASSRELFVRSDLWHQGQHLDVIWLKQQMGQGLGFLNDRLSVCEELLPLAESSHVERHGDSNATAIRLIQGGRGPVYAMSAPQTAAVVGYLGGDKVVNGDLVVDCDVFGLNFAAVGAVTLDARPLSSADQILVTLVARAENQGTEWNAVRTSVGDVWGRGGPPLAEQVPATISVRTDGAREVTALAPDGSAAGQVVASFQDGWLSFSTREGPATLHYLIRRK